MLAGAPEMVYEGDERRRSMRITGAIIEYSFDKDEPYKNPAFIKDVSSCGVCIYHDKPLEVGKEIFLKIHLFGDSIPIETKGYVVRTSKSKYVGFHEHGIDLVSLTHSEEQKISDFIMKNLVS